MTSTDASRNSRNASPSITSVAANNHGAVPGSPVEPRRQTKRPELGSGLNLDRGSRLLAWLMLGLLHLLSLIPDFILYPLGIAGGMVGYWCDRRHHVIGLINLAIAFPERSAGERRRILRASYVNLGRGAAEYIRLGGFFFRRLKRRVSYQNLEYWEELRRRVPPAGAIVLSAHFGNFELLASAHSLHGQDISLVHHTQRFLAGDAVMTYVRERAGVEVLRKHAAARAVLRALRSGRPVGIPFDQNAKRSEAIFVPFFNEIAATSSGLARLVALSAAPVVPVFIIRQPDKRSHRIEIQRQIPLQQTADAAADLEENTRRFVRAIEAIVRRYPEQFLWTHRRYRTRPPGMAALYPPKR